MNTRRPLLISAAALAAALLLPAPAAFAHCDAIDGPVVVDATSALERGDIAPVLKWISAKQEAGVREAFARTLAVRKLGADARLVADTAFFETIVRLHRETEGAPYTGLKPAGGQAMFIGKLDGALSSGSVDDFAKLVGEHAAAGVTNRFARAFEARKKADVSPADGRAYVAAYVDLMHYTGAVVAAVHAEGGHAAHAESGEAKAAGHTCD